MPVTSIRDDAHFQASLAGAGAKLVVVDFTAKWCGPCQHIAPIYERLSNKYPQVVFLKVDVDDCDQVAASNSVTAMPTFIFFRARTRVGRIQGANPSALEAKIVELAGQDTGTAGESSGQPYGPHVDLAPFIAKSGCECLNESDDHPLAHCLDASKQTYLESDCDEQLIITISFSQPIKLHSIKIKAPEEYGPKTMKLFLNQPSSLDFDKAESAEPVQSVEFQPTDLVEDAKPVQLKYVKFQNVNSLTVFVKDNQAGKDTTRISQLTLIGSPVAATNMNEFKRIGGKQGEAH
jgi:thioredoxin